MDIIALGKASRIIRDIKELDEKVMGVGAEARFLTVDERIDWLESQASSLVAVNSVNIDLTKGTFSGTETTKDGVLQLEKLGEASYVGSGTWESEVIDLGEGWQKTKLMTIKVGD